MTGAAAAFKKGFVAKGQKKAGFSSTMWIMAAQARMATRSDPLVLFFENLFIKLMASAAELGR